MNPADTDPLVDISSQAFDERSPALAISALSLSCTVKAAIPSKTKKYDTTEAVEEFYRDHLASLRNGGNHLYEKAATGIYTIYRPRIIKIARKYRSLSPVFGEDDLQQEALIAVLQALRKYRHSPDIKMKFSTYLEWSIRNIFQRAIGNRDKYVEIFTPAGAFWKTMSYARFIEHKKTLEKEGYTYTTKKRFCYLSEALPEEEDLEARLNETSMAPQEYQAFEGSSEGLAETEKTGTGEDAAAESEPGTPVNGSGSGNGLNLEMIDGLYRQWRRLPDRPSLTPNDPLVLRIYGLCRQDSEAFSLPSGNNNAGIGDEAERSALSTIARSLARHSDDSVPRIPFSMSLRAAIRTAMKALRRARALEEKGGVSDE
ncbi:MAG: Sigma-70 region 2 [Syntrophorhabdus sp. PtaB.Bin184]|nr:MAG: Sigma-70 region 2 [Syntrophorhabdus sp. PtaB.Bin184]